jgi:hypothetical protein
MNLLKVATVFVLLKIWEIFLYLPYKILTFLIKSIWNLTRNTRNLIINYWFMLITFFLPLILWINSQDTSDALRMFAVILVGIMISFLLNIIFYTVIDKLLISHYGRYGIYRDRNFTFHYDSVEDVNGLILTFLKLNWKKSEEIVKAIEEEKSFSKYLKKKVKNEK